MAKAKLTNAIDWLEKQGEQPTDEEMKEALHTEYEKGRADAIAEMQKPAKYEMLMIGDASGKSGQFSNSDKKTAENYGIDYMDIKDFVQLKKK